MREIKIIGKKGIEDLELAAREILELPALPNGATGPKSQALLKQIQEDVIVKGKDFAVKKYIKYCTLTYACCLDDDSEDCKKLSKKTIKDLENPNKKNEYIFPDSDLLQSATNDLEKRKKCCSKTLNLLDSIKK